MSKKYAYNHIQIEQGHDQNPILYQYQSGSNPLDPLGLKKEQYTFLDASKNSTNTQNIVTYPNIAFTTNVKQQIYEDQNQAYSQPGHSAVHLLQYQLGHKIM